MARQSALSNPAKRNRRAMAILEEANELERDNFLESESSDDNDSAYQKYCLRQEIQSSREYAKKMLVKRRRFKKTKTAKENKLRTLTRKNGGYVRRRGERKTTDFNARGSYDGKNNKFFNDKLVDWA
ncbi:MAG: hypothetical protein MJZ22_01065 [Candidatus Saccharibacteria bacterium]|nr:hypothetical protein [Candidatus Saccharibacteria bacterium]